jgi:quercetin dioxygenase-like cupin family protein
MTTFDKPGLARVPAILTPAEQRAVWFLGALIHVRAGGDSTGGQLAILEHAGPRGYSSPLHLHNVDEETFFILDGDVRVEVGDRAFSAGPGAVAFLPRQLPHAFVVTSREARFLTLHMPSGFDEFTLAAGAPADYPFREPTMEPPDPVALAATAASYGIEILGPPPTPQGND